MKHLLLLAALASPTAFAADACDRGNGTYECKSASGKYSARVRFCGEDNLATPMDLKAPAKPAFTGYELSQAWLGNGFLGLDFSLTTADGSDRSVSIGVSLSTMKGTVEDRTRPSDPGGWKDLGQETIRCTESSE